MFTIDISKKWLRKAGMGIMFAIFASNASAEIIFSAAPRETVEEGQALYGPMVEALSEALGQEVVYQHPGSWRNYQKKIKSGEYDIYLDGAHLAAWRMENQQARPLVRLPGELSFVLVSKAGNRTVTTPEDLIGRKICHMPSPNLGTLTLFSIYENPVRQPSFIIVNGGAKKLLAAMDEGRCEATILRKKYYHKKLDAATKSKFNVLETTAGITNQGFTISSRVDDETVTAIQNFLTSDAGKFAAQKLLKRFSPGTEKLVASSHDEYQGLNLMAKNTMFGW